MRETELTLTQKAALLRVYKQGPGTVIGTVTAQALIRLGLLAQTSIWPVPTKGIACHTTIRGDSWCEA